MREKLIKLIREAFQPCEMYRAMLIADHLIANGVTFATDNNVGSRWIPVTERLPEDEYPVLVTCGKGYRSFIARYDLIWKRWRVSHTLRITHWMPMPKPPKEVE